MKFRFVSCFWGVFLREGIKIYRVLRGVGVLQGRGWFLGNPEDSVWEDWGSEQGTLGESPPPLRITTSLKNHHLPEESPPPLRILVPSPSANFPTIFSKTYQLPTLSTGSTSDFHLGATCSHCTWVRWGFCWWDYNLGSPTRHHHFVIYIYTPWN